MTTDAEVAAATRRWHALHLRSLALAAHRRAHVCADESSTLEQWPIVGHADPCWKRTVQIAPDDCERLPFAEWCATCQARHTIHIELRCVVASRGAALRNLRRLLSLVTPTEPT